MAFKPEMKAKDALELYLLFVENNIETWVDGGWGVDALLGKQTRKHSDLDIAIWHKDVTKLRQLLEARGYTDVSRDDTWECNFVLGDKHGRQVDIHTFTLDKNGKNVFGLAYQGIHLGGEGRISGRKVKTINPKSLVKFHTGYEIDEEDYEDTLALCKKFGIAQPKEHIAWAQRHISN